MGTWAYKTKLDGVEALIAQFDGAPKALKAALKRAGRKSMTKVAKVMRGKVPFKKMKKKRGEKSISLVTGQTGSLKRSIGTKVGVNTKTGQVYAMAGPRRKKDFPTVDAISSWTGKPVKVMPSKYAHLVERGFNLKIRGKVVKRIPGKPFLRPSFDEAKGQINEETKAALDLELAKLFAAKTAAAAKAAAKAMESAGGAD